MPFDGKLPEVSFTYDPNVPAREAIQRTRLAICMEELWCRWVLYDLEGRFCLMGALRHVEKKPAIKVRLIDLLSEEAGKMGYGSISQVNDEGGFLKAHELLDRVEERLR